MAESVQFGFGDLMNDPSGAMALAIHAGREFLSAASASELLSQIGSTIAAVPRAAFPDKRWFQASYGRDVSDRPDDLLVGRGLFYLTEQGKLNLDCTGGHYQMTWGYDHPQLRALLLDGIDRGIVWDNHSNIPSAPVKRLAGKLVELANPGADLEALQADGERLNTVLLGTATGTVACAAAMKIQLVHYSRAKRGEGSPAFVVLDGNYHGTDMFAQHLRGMWPGLFADVEVVAVEPNDCEQLEATFSRLGERVAGFWAEPIMMNREAIEVEAGYLQLARELCDGVGALMAIDEIQTGFWYPEVFYTKRLGIVPDFIVLGKGLTAGLHPLSALLYKGKLDMLEQYDAISTNGNAALAAYMGLGCIELIERNAQHVGEMGERFHNGMAALAARFPETLQEVRGVGHLSGIKFHDREDALGFHRQAVAEGYWIRAHAYHEGHSTVLTKFALPMDAEVADHALG